MSVDIQKPLTYLANEVEYERYSRTDGRPPANRAKLGRATHDLINALKAA